MQGLKAKFDFNGGTYELQRARFSEMVEYVDRISDNEVLPILAEAAGEKSKDFMLELENNPALVGALWFEYVEFFGYEAWFRDFFQPQQAQIKRVTALVRGNTAEATTEN